MTRRLLVTLHDVSPHHSEAVRAIMDDLAGLIGPGRCGLLLVPDFHRVARLDRDAGFVRAISRWAEAGSEVFLHGYYHLDSAHHSDPAAALKARHLTAGEGEFLGLAYSEAARRLREGLQLVEQVAARPVSGFIAPAWLYGPQALAAIADMGFACVEDHFRVWHPATGQVFERGPVITYATRSRIRALSSLAFSRFAKFALARQRTVRLAIHPSDRASAPVYREMLRRIAQFSRTHVPAGYAAVTG